MAGITCARAADNVRVTVNSNVTEGSCDISGPATQRFTVGYLGSDFTPAQRTVETMRLDIRVSNCHGNAPGRHPAILVTGALLAGETDIFADSASVATNVGVAVRQGVYSGPLSSFYTPGQMVSQANPQTYVNQINTVQGGIYPYTLGLVSNGSTPGLGQVKATLMFEFKYQ